MRITKVKLDREMITMQRTPEHGELHHGTKKYDDNPHKILSLIQKKTKEFKQSLLNKTLSKDGYFTDKFKKEKNKKNPYKSNENLKNLRGLFTHLLISETPSFNTSYLKQISQKDLAEYFTHRFNSGVAIKYKLKDETKIVLNLVECTYNALQQSCH